MIRCAVRPLAGSVAAAFAAHEAAAQVDGVWMKLIVGSLAGLVVYVPFVATWSRDLLTSVRPLWSGGVDDDLVVEARPPLRPAAEGARA
jgi:hypothetical protein